LKEERKMRMNNKQQIPSSRQQQLIAAAQIFSEDVSNEKDDVVAINMLAFSLRWLQAGQKEN
jgi:hypothetical protein